MATHRQQAPGATCNLYPMFESFVIMLREGIEAALVVAIILVVLKRSGRRDLERAVFRGVGLAVVASIGAAVALNLLAIDDDAYEGGLYLVSALFVGSMMGWMHRKARSLRADVEQRVRRAAATGSARDGKGAWMLGGFAFLMVFREGAEAVMFLSAVNLTTDALLSFIGSVLGLGLAVVFCVMFVRGSLKVNLRRFFTVTEWVLGIFVIQLLVNGYHESAEAGLLPATQKSMALLGPIVRNNSLFILAIVAIPLFIWLSRSRTPAATEMATAAEVRLAVAASRREKFYRYGAIATSLLVLTAVGVVYAADSLPKKAPAPEMVVAQKGWITVPVSKLVEGQLNRLGLVVSNKLVRFLILKTTDGRVHTALDACNICGSFGYVRQGKNLVCLNCGAEINPMTLGMGGGCNPIPLPSEVTNNAVRIAVSELNKSASLFPAAGQTEITSIDPVCGMKVKINQATDFKTYQGETYYFCSERCCNMFRRNPAAYSSKTPPVAAKMK
jgi:high-affinity iron transporter